MTYNLFSMKAESSGLDGQEVVNSCLLNLLPID